MVGVINPMVRFFKAAVREASAFFFCKRVAAFFIVWLFYLYIFMSPIREVAVKMNYPATPWGILFAFSGLYFNLIFIVGAIYLYARVPFMERWQMYQLIRLGRQKWIGIQIFKIVAASFLYTAAVLASGVLIMMPHLEWKADWGKLYHTLALTNVQDEIDLGFFVSYRLINDYEPAKLMLISALVFFLVVSFIGLTMFLISLCFSRAVSVIMATSLAIAEIAVENAGRRMQRVMVHFIPTEWIKISKAGTKNIMGILSPDFDDIMIRLFIIVLILMILIYLSGSRVSYNFYGEE